MAFSSFLLRLYNVWRISSIQEWIQRNFWKTIWLVPRIFQYKLPQIQCHWIVSLSSGELSTWFNCGFNDVKAPSKEIKTFWMLHSCLICNWNWQWNWNFLRSHFKTLHLFFLIYFWLWNQIYCSCWLSVWCKGWKWEGFQDRTDFEVFRTSSGWKTRWYFRWHWFFRAFRARWWWYTDILLGSKFVYK